MVLIKILFSLRSVHLIISVTTIIGGAITMFLQAWENDNVGNPHIIGPVLDFSKVSCFLVSEVPVLHYP